MQALRENLDSSMLEPRNLFYTKTFIFLLITFLSGSIPNLVDMQKNGVTLEKSLYLVVSALGAIGITIDKMEKEPNVFTFKGLAGRNIEDVQKQAPQVELKPIPDQVAESVVEVIPEIKVPADLQPVVKSAETFAVKSLIKGLFK